MARNALAMDVIHTRRNSFGTKACMNQLAWLDFYGGKWHLATSVSGNSVRRWADREAALSDLADG
jgi:hypothetical protein